MNTTKPVKQSSIDKLPATLRNWITQLPEPYRTREAYRSFVNIKRITTHKNKVTR